MRRAVWKQAAFFYFYGIMGRYYSCGVSFLIIMVLTGCGRSPRLQPFPDPVRDAWGGKGIHSVTEYVSDYRGQSYEDIRRVLDEQGNTIYLLQMMRNEWREYDSLNFPVRIRQTADVPHNYVIRYRQQGDTLYQKWIAIRHLKWNFVQDDLNLNDSFTVKFVLNSKGHVIREIGGFGHRLKAYEYDEQGRLVSKLILAARENRVIERETYQYNQNGLTGMSKVNMQDTITYYFHDGIPNSAVTRSTYLIHTRYQYSRDVPDSWEYVTPTD